MAPINWSIFRSAVTPPSPVHQRNCNEKICLLSPISISVHNFLFQSKTILYHMNSKHGLKLFDIATKSRTQLFAKSIFSSINKTDIKTIYTAINIMGIDMNHDNEFSYDLSLFKQNLDKHFDSKTIDGKSTYYGNND